MISQKCHPRAAAAAAVARLRPPPPGDVAAASATGTAMPVMGWPGWALQGCLMCAPESASTSEMVADSGGTSISSTKTKKKGSKWFKVA